MGASNTSTCSVTTPADLRPGSRPGFPRARAPACHEMLTESARNESQLGDAPLEKAPLRLRVRKLERPPVGGPGLLRASKAQEQLGAGRVQVLVVVEREGVDDRECRLWPLDLGNGDRAVELHHRRAGQADELLVQ
jgi:hypothetical protein